MRIESCIALRRVLLAGMFEWQEEKMKASIRSKAGAMMHGKSKTGMSMLIDEFTTDSLTIRAAKTLGGTW